MTTVDRVAQVVERLEQMILSEQLGPGDRLPPERELGARLSVSRSVVREALGRLESLGLVESVQGSGTRVATPSGQQITTAYAWMLRHGGCRLEDLSIVRLPLETTIARLAAEHRTAEHLTRLDKTQTVLSNSRRSLKAHIAADLQFHAILAEATGNPMFQLVLAPIQQLLIESRRRTLGSFGVDLAHEHHARILAAVAAQDPDAAASAMADHIQTNTQHLANLGSEGA
jgi:DNA-binding FadR family transcriptional regulator